MKMPKDGTKLFLSIVCLAFMAGVMAASYVLALTSKLTPEWVQLVSIWLPSVTVVTVGYGASSAFVNGRAIEHGLEQPKGGD